MIRRYLGEEIDAIKDQFETPVTKGRYVAYALFEGEEALSYLLLRKRVYVFSGERILVSEILEVTGQDEHRVRLFDEVMKIHSFQDLVTFVLADRFEVFAQFDFEPLLFKNRFVIEHQDDLLIKDPMEVKEGGDPKDLFRLYKLYASHFEGYLDHSPNDFTDLDHVISCRGGYMIYDLFDDEIYVRECAYKDSRAMCSMLQELQARAKRVCLSLSYKEHLHYFPGNVSSAIEREGLVRVNDLELYSRLFGRIVTGTKEAMSLSGRPLFRILEDL